MIIRKITIMVLVSLLILATFPFYAAAALEDTSSGINVLGLPTPVITGIDAKNSIVHLKADGYINDNAELLATVALVNENGDVVDVAEKKVSNPEDIRVSLRTDKINVGSVISAKFTNRGIGGGEAGLTHDEPEPVVPGEEPEPATPGEESKEPVEEPKETVALSPTQTVIHKGGGSSVTYIVTEAEPEQVIIEKLIEAEPEPAANIIRNTPVYIYVSSDNNNSKSASVDNTLLNKQKAPQIITEEASPIEILIKDGKLSAKDELILFSFLVALNNCDSRSDICYVTLFTKESRQM